MRFSKPYLSNILNSDNYENFITAFMYQPRINAMSKSFSKKQRDNHEYYEQQNFSSDWRKNGEVTLYKYNSREREYATWGRYDLYKKVNNGNPVYKVIYYGEDLIIYRNQSYNPTSSRFCDQCKYIAGEYYIKDL